MHPQEHKQTRYTAQHNQNNGHVPVMCSYEEPLTAVRGEDTHHTERDINHLIWELRNKRELDPKVPRILETVRGLGYRLVTPPKTKEES